MRSMSWKPATNSNSPQHLQSTRPTPVRRCCVETRAKLRCPDGTADIFRCRPADRVPGQHSTTSRCASRRRRDMQHSWFPQQHEPTSLRPATPDSEDWNQKTRQDKSPAISQHRQLRPSFSVSAGSSVAGMIRPPDSMFRQGWARLHIFRRVGRIECSGNGRRSVPARTDCGHCTHRLRWDPGDTACRRTLCHTPTRLRDVRRSWTSSRIVAEVPS